MINSLCGGTGKCGRCRVSINHQSSPQCFNSPTNVEKQLLNESIHQNIRLACQIIPKGNGDISITILELSEYRDSVFKIQDTYRNFKLNYFFNPRVCSYALDVPPPTLERSEDDFLRLSKSLERSLRPPDLAILSQFVAKLREQNGRVQIVIDTQWNQVLKLEAHTFHVLGGVVDVGTTSVVATLVNLETGSILGADSILNPQIEFGRDIMSRLTHALKSPSHQQQLQQKIFKGVSDLFKGLTSSINHSITDICEIIVVGNSAMHHLFLNLPVVGLSRAPFVPVISETLSYYVKDISETKYLNLSPHTIVTFPPLIGGFIGSDAIVDILYTDFHKKEGTHLLIDFGTNSEIILLKDYHLYAASVAAGGAFEGQHIACGMRGVAGAIEKFQIENEKYQYETIQSIAPKGICGTGIIDILAQLLIHEQLDSRGQLFTLSREKTKKLILVPAHETSNNQAIYLTRKDVEAIQKAKAATLAAIRTLTTHLNIGIEEIDSINIAGVFGSNLDINNVKTIGLLPNLPNERYKIHGNTAEKGGRTFLLSKNARKATKTITTSIERLELTQFPKFQFFFTEGLFFPKIKNKN